MRVQESRENYLEAILMLQKKHGYVLSLIHISEKPIFRSFPRR